MMNSLDSSSALVANRRRRQSRPPPKSAAGAVNMKRASRPASRPKPKPSQRNGAQDVPDIAGVATEVPERAPEVPQRPKTEPDTAFLQDLLQREQQKLREQEKEEAAKNLPKDNGGAAPPKSKKLVDFLPKLPSVDELILAVNPATQHHVERLPATDDLSSLEEKITAKTRQIAELHRRGASHEDTLELVSELLNLKHRLQQQSGRWISKDKVLGAKGFVVKSDAPPPLEEQADELPSPTVAPFAQGMHQGVEVMRHQPAGSPEFIVLRVVGSEIVWMPQASAQANADWNDARRLPLHEVASLKLGKTTTNFRKRLAEWAAEDCCFSIVTYGSYTMDLQCRSKVDREALVAALRSVVEESS